MLFQYKYITDQGKRKKGIIQALNLEDAKEKLLSKNFLLISIDDVSNKRCKSSNLKSETLITFTTQLSSLLRAGMPLYESLLSLEEQYRGDSYHSVLMHLCTQIKEGTPLSKAMSAFPESFSDLYCNMISAGEAVGSIDTTLEKLATLLQKQNKLKKQLLTAMLYPAVLGGFSLIVLTVLLTFVIPSLEMLFEERNVNSFTKLVIGLSHFITHQWPFYIPALFIMSISGYFIIMSSQVKRFVQWQMLKIPILKTLITQVIIARFSRTLGTLLNGGVSFINALQIAKQVMRNPFFEEIISLAEKRIVEGSLLSIELKKSSLIPTLLPRMLAIGEEVGTISTMLQKIADLYEEEIEKTISRFTTLIQPIILIVVGGIVGIIMMAVLLPLTDINAFL